MNGTTHGWALSSRTRGASSDPVGSRRQLDTEPRVGNEGQAVVYCQGELNGRRAAATHSLIRRSERYRVLAVVDRRFAGRDAREVIDGVCGGIPVVADLDEALAAAAVRGIAPTHLVLGVEFEPGSLPSEVRSDLARALQAGLHVISGLFEFLSDDPELGRLARERGVTILDLKQPRPWGGLALGRIDQVESRRFAVLGTDVHVGKLATCWALADALNAAGHATELVGTSVGAWLSGARNTVLVDGLTNALVRAEIENEIWSVWAQRKPQAILVQGRGSLLSPVHPGGLEVIAAARPDCIVLQHAPARRYYEDSTGFRVHSLVRQIDAIELIAGRRVVAVAVSGEDLSRENAERAFALIEEETGLPVADPLRDGVAPIIDALLPYLVE